MRTIPFLICIVSILLGFNAFAETESAAEPSLANAADVITDPQNDFLSPDGVTWGLVGQSVTDNKTVEHIGMLFKAAKANNIPVFISPHYYYPTDHGWQFEGTLEKVMHNINMFDRKDALSLEGFEGSGADWLEEYKPYISDGKTIVTSPHKVYGPETNDLVLQLRKRKVDTVFRAACLPTYVLSLICANCWNRVSKS